MHQLFCGQETTKMRLLSVLLVVAGGPLPMLILTYTWYLLLRQKDKKNDIFLTFNRLIMQSYI